MNTDYDYELTPKQNIEQRLDSGSYSCGSEKEFLVNLLADLNGVGVDVLEV